ncbi:MAG: DUF3857 and transglutaminase domain-containing protein [Bacteroidales bacterium]|nr:DUF3857 and transglutaminase domain-containing protein [Bacteroidales bacterium]
MKFDKISQEELEMTSYAPDTSAGAVVLGDYGITRFTFSEDSWFDLEFKRHVRIKILDKSELNWGNFNIILYVGVGGSEEDITLLKAYTYNLEDGVVKKDKLERKDAFFEEKIDKNHKQVKFTMPNVKVGSVIDVTYTIKSPFLFNLNKWYFQRNIPVVHSEYHVFIPEYFNYKNWINGYVIIKKESDIRNEKFTYHEAAAIEPGMYGGRTSGGMRSFEAKITHWSYLGENVPAYKNEPYITNDFDYLSSLEFELISTEFPMQPVKYYTSTWDKINEEMMEDDEFGRQIDNKGHLTEYIEKINQATENPHEKLQLSFELIKSNLKWDKRYRVFSTTNVRRAFTEGGGSSADINLNLVALCRGLGLKADPVLVSTRSNGMVKPGMVIMTQFNHVIAAIKIDDKMYLLDAIDPLCSYDLLPPNTLNGKGFLVSKGGYQWVDLYSKVKLEETLYCQLKINEDLELEGIYQKNLKDYAAYALRKEIDELTDGETYSDKFESGTDGLQVIYMNIENTDSIYKPVKLSAEIILADAIIEGGDHLYFNPILFNRMKENLFKNDERKYPVDYNYPIHKRMIFNITIPEGYTFEEIPAPQRIALTDNGGRFIYTASRMGQVLSINCDFQLNQTIYPSTNYGELKKFYEIIVAKQAEQVVLKKTQDSNL